MKCVGSTSHVYMMSDLKLRCHFESLMTWNSICDVIFNPIMIMIMIMIMNMKVQKPQNSELMLPSRQRSN